MTKLFISYRSLDSIKVDAIVARLRTLRHSDETPQYTIWQDKTDIPDGHDWWQAIVDAIIDCNVFIYMVSRESVNNINCRAELSYARKRNRPVVPLVLEGEFIYNATTAKNDIDYWNDIPQELLDLRAQFLFYEGASFVGRIETAVSKFLNNPNSWRDIHEPRPRDPRNSSDETNSTIALYDEAVDYAWRMEFDAAERWFQKLVNLNDADFAADAHQWILVLREYKRLLSLDSRAATRYKVKDGWAAYRSSFPKPFIAGIYDPKNLHSRINLSPSKTARTRKKPSNTKKDVPVPTVKPNSAAAFWDNDVPTGKVPGLGNKNTGQDDPLYEKAVEMVRQLSTASASLLQRNLDISYPRAARLIDQMKQEGVIRPAVEGDRVYMILPDDSPEAEALYKEAVEMVRRLNKASVSLLQRRLRIGYSRAARLIDLMEKEGIIGPAVDGARPREVLAKRDDAVAQPDADFASAIENMLADIQTSVPTRGSAFLPSAASLSTELELPAGNTSSIPDWLIDSVLEPTEIPNWLRAVYTTPSNALGSQDSASFHRARTFTDTHNRDWQPVITTFPELQIPDMQFCLVPVGSFKMGEGKEAHPQIIDQPIWIAKFPVTNTQWTQAVKAGVVEQPDGNAELQMYKDTKMADAPVVGIDWFMARKFAEWLGCRLPTEAEWEWAVRGPESWMYPWGNDFDGNRLVYRGNSSGKPALVGSDIRPNGASWVGTHDMSGNVWEWCSSLYRPYPYLAGDGREDLEDKTTSRVRRGGSWLNNPDGARAVSRDYNPPDVGYGVIGLRVVHVPLSP